MTGLGHMGHPASSPQLYAVRHMRTPRLTFVTVLHIVKTLRFMEGVGVLVTINRWILLNLRHHITNTYFVNND